MNRRHFLQKSLVTSAIMATAEQIVANPYQRIATPLMPVLPVRIRGKIQAGRNGVPRVAVTDGISVTTTDARGEFTLISDGRQPFVHISIPSGYEIPKNAAGTAKFYEKIQPNARGEMQVAFNLKPKANEMHHQFVTWADTQTQDLYETKRLQDETAIDTKAFVQTAGNVAFGVACGDIMFDDLKLYPEFEKAVATTDIPFFQVVGNHDLNFSAKVTENSTQTFSQHFGPTYYSFNRGAVHYVVLNDVFWHTQGYFGYLDERQLTWLAQDLALIEKGKPVVVFYHIPAISTLHKREKSSAKPEISNSVTNREALYKLLEGYKAHIISGHTHEHEHIFAGGVHEHNIGTACGAWWSGDICGDGTPNGYLTFAYKDESPSWKYKSTGKALDYQMRVYQKGANPQFPNEIVANVWDFDPEWKVFWYEDSIRKGLMTQRLSNDPLAEQTMRGDQKPERRKWAEPYPNEHLFYAAVSADAKDIRVEVVNRFGETFMAKV